MAKLLPVTRQDNEGNILDNLMHINKIDNRGNLSIRLQVTSEKEYMAYTAEFYVTRPPYEHAFAS